MAEHLSAEAFEERVRRLAALARARKVERDAEQLGHCQPPLFEEASRDGRRVA